MNPSNEIVTKNWLGHARKVRSGFRCLSLLAMLVLMSGTATAGTIVVNTSGDLVGRTSRCSLRSAIIAAETDAPWRGCPAGSGADTIVVDYSPTLTAAEDINI